MTPRQRHALLTPLARADGDAVADEPAEKEAIRCLRGAGGDRECWIWNGEVNVGHLRVAVTRDEHDQMPIRPRRARRRRERAAA